MQTLRANLHMHMCMELHLLPLLHEVKTYCNVALAGVNMTACMQTAWIAKAMQQSTNTPAVNASLCHHAHEMKHASQPKDNQTIVPCRTGPICCNCSKQSDTQNDNNMRAITIESSESAKGKI